MKVKFKSFLKIMLVLLMVFSLVACDSGEPKQSGDSESKTSSETASNGDPIVIGGTFTVSGPVSHAGKMALEGAEAAIKYVNEELGGINGRPVELKYYDDEFDESKIPMLYERLITQDKVDLLVSPYTSPFLAAAPVVAKHDKMMFCIAADSYVANDSFGQNIVNIQMDDKWRGGQWWHDVAEFFVNFDEWNTKGLEKPKTIAVCNLNISYGQEIADSVIPYWKENGFDIVYNELFEPGHSDWAPVISKLKELKPDIVFVPHYFEDSVRFVEKAKELDYSADYMIIEGMGWDTLSWTRPELGGLAPEVAQKGFFSYSVYKDKYESDTKDYLAKVIKEKYDHVPGNDHLTGFMAVELAAKAANKAGSIEKDKLIETLTNNEFTLAAYPYQMNSSGGNGSDFRWGVGQYIPPNIDEAVGTDRDWHCVWPANFKDADPVYPFPGW
ncbi:ABC transporter substrate-binding protein [Microaceticoccus formicicus]|uniref:ABC transporter substrate-binding protein n=1 Tax=Microaceticoccus formicicus TaxID=3118105 RepID=UPI003CD01732|nr:ABC transporter substrate-binding protein [Peptoniphilaceae bacterium AMB_02]